MTTCFLLLLFFLPAPTPLEQTVPRTTEWWHGTFKPYAGARKLCSQHVIGKPFDIFWTAYATTDEPEKVVLSYATDHQVKTKPRATTLTIGSKDEKKQLSVHPVSSSYPRCGVNASPAEKTVIIVSERAP